MYIIKLSVTKFDYGFKRNHHRCLFMLLSLSVITVFIRIIRSVKRCIIYLLTRMIHVKLIPHVDQNDQIIYRQYYSIYNNETNKYWKTLSIDDQVNTRTYESQLSHHRSIVLSVYTINYSTVYTHKTINRECNFFIWFGGSPRIFNLFNWYN